MFTGLIEDLGTVRRLEPGQRSTTLTVATALAAEGFSEGESLAVNGACLTVVTADAGGVRLTAVAETMARTALADLRVGHRVNLERPLRLGARLDGHLVQGHVDGVGRLEQVRPDGDAYRVTVGLPVELERYLVPKGSVALDGISLTVATLEAGRFEVSVIPHTWEQTTLADRQVGDHLNLEMDIIGKYVAKMLETRDAPVERLSAAKLAEHGFL